MYTHFDIEKKDHLHICTLQGNKVAREKILWVGREGGKVDEEVKESEERREKERGRGRER